MCKTYEIMTANKSKYNSVGEWRRAKPNDYASAQRQGLVAFICEYYGWKVNKPRGYWDSKENVMAEAKKYNTKTEWRKNSSRSYNSAWDNKWIDECVAHMIELRKPIGYWDIKENVMADAKKYKTRTEWDRNSSGSYKSARKNGWDDECTAHMVEINKPRGHWNSKENVMSEAKKYNTKKEWKKNSSGSYNSAWDNKWIDECSAHMIGLNKPKGYWNIKENVLAEAIKYETRNEWNKNSSASYQYAWKNGWIDECTAHMIEARKPSGYWNIKENVMAEAIKYETRGEWSKNSMSSYRNARKNGWIDECAKHMK